MGNPGSVPARMLRFHWIGEDPVDPAQNSLRLSNTVFYNDFCTFCRKMITFLGGWCLGRPLPAKMAPHAIWTACGAPFGGLLEPMLAPRWPKWHQDGQVGGKLAVKLSSFAPREEFSIYTNSRSTAKRPLCYTIISYYTISSDVTTDNAICYDVITCNIRSHTVT